jgi:ElaB/YqjD/DUF883 family membrane-anchored ribosome-binding protein
MWKTVSFAISFLIIAAVVGCSKPPETELKAARGAFEAAKRANAQLYATSTFKSASDSLNAAEAEKKAQDGKSAFARKYARTKELINRAENLAKRAATEAEGAKVKMKADVEGLLVTARAQLDTVSAALAKVSGKKIAKADLQQMKDDLSVFETFVDQATAEIKKETYPSARAKLSMVIGKTRQMLQEIANPAIRRTAPTPAAKPVSKAPIKK